LPPPVGPLGRLQLPAFWLTLDSIRPARPSAVITLAAWALSAQTRGATGWGRMPAAWREQVSALPAAWTGASCKLALLGGSPSHALTLTERSMKGRGASSRVAFATSGPACTAIERLGLGASSAVDLV
jgi:hypothetical protein